MKRLIAVVALAVPLLFAVSSTGAEHHVKVDLVPNGSSGVSGFVELTQLPHGGTEIQVVAHGLQSGGTYASFYYRSSNCTAPADLLGTFTGNPAGVGTVRGKIDDDLDEVGSVSVRVGPGYGALLACAKVH